ncbi:uncharacterized protein LOC131640457 [Vicia villosa]|uniref:uncharacterized protein LOC131640457 n=1 Tax=Vicia villosa TaxID=3911 RepID=UPI00273CE932|nr:uncharacterized protein LOC131640457 [Vicia villosa]
MSQQSSDESPVSDSATQEESSNPNRILKVVPLRIISSDEVKATKPKTTHEKWPKDGIHNKGTKPSASATMEELTKEGSKYVDSAITRFSTRILKENHQVPGISIPLQTIMAYPLKNSSKAEAVHTVDNTNLVDLDEYSDNELLTSLNPSVANRLITRRKGKVVVQGSPKRSTQVNNPAKDAVRKKSTYAGPGKSKVVTKSKGVGPSKSWSKKYVLQKRLVVKRELAPNALENEEVLELTQEAGLLKKVCNLPKYYEKLVKEFVVNLSEDCGNSRSVDFRKVFVRGKCVSFSPSVINNFFERKDEAQPELEVTDNKVCQVITAKQVNSWPLKEKLTASKLSIKYAMLHKIGAANWVPKNHKSTISTILGRFIYAVGTKAKFDYGAYIFFQTMKHAGSFGIKGPIAFPSLLCGIILDQYPNILNEHDVVCKRESPLAFHYKLIRTLEMDENEEFADTEKMEDKDEQELEEESASPADDSEKESSSDTLSGFESGQ